MSGRALSVFGAFTPGALAGGVDASVEWRRTQRALEIQAEDAERQIALMDEVFTAQLAGQEAIAETQQTAIETLTEAQGVTNDALVELQTEIENDADEAAKWRDGYGALLDEMQRVVKRVYNFLATRPTSSAGGRVGYKGAGGLDKIVDGWPHATGDVKLTHQRELISSAWMLCDGTQRRRADYPDLCWMIGDEYGAGESSEYFRLPAKSDLTDDTAILNNDRLQFYIRT